MADSRAPVDLREIDLDDVRELDQRLQFRTVGKIVESKQRSAALLVPTGFDDIRISIDRLKELDDGRVGRKCFAVAAEQKTSREVDKGFPIFDQSRGPERQPCGLKDILRSFGRIAVRADVLEPPRQRSSHQCTCLFVSKIGCRATKTSCAAA